MATYPTHSASTRAIHAHFTTDGEVVQFWGYLVALRMGRHGMHKNRFRRLEALQAQMFSKDEDELDENDPWRYCRSPLRAFDERRAALINPSWLMTLDESMAAWTGVEGVEPGKGANFKPIPFLSVSASARSCRRARELWVWELGWGGREGSGTEAGSGREQGCRSE